MTKHVIEAWSPEGMTIRDLEIMEEALERLSSTILLFQNQPRVDGEVADTLEDWSSLFSHARERVVKAAQEFIPSTHEEMRTRCCILLKYETCLGLDEPEKVISIMSDLMTSALQTRHRGKLEVAA